MKKRYTLLLLCLLSLPITLYAQTVTNLRCNDEEHPISIDDLHPGLSWQIISSKQGTSQSAYRIVVASSLQKLNKNIADIWDSKKINTDQSCNIPYNGRPLLSSRTYYWKIRIWDEKNRPTGWSPAAHWQMGLLNPADWKGRWVTASKWFTPEAYRPKGFQLNSKGGWADIDLGEPKRVQKMRLFPLDSASFPERFKILGSNEFNFSKSAILVDRTDQNYTTKGNMPLDLSIAPANFRFIRLMVLPNDHKKNTTIRQLEVLSDGKNAALYKFTREYNTAWDHGHAPFLVDGMPSQNGGHDCPPDACPSTAAPQFRKVFTVNKKILSATLYFAALGMVDITLNGRKVSEDELGPPFTDYTKRVMYVAYDITPLIHQGQNAFGAVLGNGFFSTPKLGFGQRQNGHGPPRFLLQTQIKYTDGSTQLIGTDNTWKWTCGEITFNDIWEGYSEDRHLAKPGWQMPGYNDAQWANAKETAGLSGKLVSRSGPPNRINGILKPARVENDHAYFETVSVGWPLLKVDGKAGQHITITGTGPGYRMAKLDFILADDGPATLSPRFIIQPGPMDIQVSGLTAPLKSDDISIRYVNADLKQTGSFNCSNVYLNRLFAVAMHTHRNYVNDFPADPNREKQGWTQDVQNMFNTAAYFTDVKELYLRWWKDMADSQDEQGYLGSVVPMVGRQVYDWNSPWWSGMIVYLPWEHYQYYGDKKILLESYQAMRRYVDFLARMASAGEGKNWADYPYFTQNLDTAAAKDKMIIWNGAGDWNNPFTKDQHAVPTAMTTMPAWYDFAMIVSKTAGMLGKKDDAAKYASMAGDIKERFNRKYLHKATGLYGDTTNSQTGQILPLAVGIVPENKTDLTYARLLDAIHERGDHIGTGFTSINYLLHILATRRESVLANKMINQQDYPGWNTLIKNDVFQEDWHGGGAQMPSCGGAVGAWLFQSVLGIQPDAQCPGFKHFILSPQPDKATGLFWATGYYDCPYGRIAVNWKCADHKFIMDIEIPANTSAMLCMPSTEPVKLSSEFKHIKYGHNLITCEAGSGKHHLETSY